MADVLKNLLTQGIRKRIIYAGKGTLSEFFDGCKVLFHYVTSKCDDSVLDDSRKQNEPMELIIGKKFKIEAWEICLKTMRCGEVSEFTCDTQHTVVYPHVAKTLRDVAAGHQHSSSHCCGMAAVAMQSVGYDDLDELVKTPQPLKFTFELISVQNRSTNDKEVWELNDDERKSVVPKLKEDGNILYRNGKYTDASSKYATAIGILDQLMLREKPNDEEWLELDSVRLPILSNYSQCLLHQKDYYAVIEHTSEIIGRQPAIILLILQMIADNVKALYRRGKAHVGAWNPNEARADFQKVMSLDASMTSTILKELKNIDTQEIAKNAKDKELYKGKIFTS